jgi:hypothetical protein
MAGQCFASSNLVFLTFYQLRPLTDAMVGKHWTFGLMREGQAVTEAKLFMRPLAPGVTRDNFVELRKLSLAVPHYAWSLWAHRELQV